MKHIRAIRRLHAATPHRFSRSAAKNRKRSPGSTPPARSMDRTSSSRLRSRTVVRTRRPAARSCRRAWLPTKPEPPHVTRTSSTKNFHQRYGSSAFEIKDARRATHIRHANRFLRLIIMRNQAASASIVALWLHGRSPHIARSYLRALTLRDLQAFVVPSPANPAQRGCVLAAGKFFGRHSPR